MSLIPNLVWFGTRDNMRWVPAPLADYNPTQVHWRAVDQFLNGGAAVRQSSSSHRELNLNWGINSIENLSPVVSALSEPGPYFYVDPVSSIGNVVPPYWATTYLWAEDAPVLVPDISVSKTVFSPANGYPATAASFNVPTTRDTALEFCIPPGYTLHVGVHGSSGTYALKGKAGTFPVIPPLETLRTNATFAGPGFTSLRVGAGTHNIQGIIAQILPGGQIPTRGGFIPGLGFTALQLSGDPTITSYSAVHLNAQMGVAADFIEVGAWLG